MVQQNGNLQSPQAGSHHDFRCSWPSCRWFLVTGISDVERQLPVFLLVDSMVGSIGIFSQCPIEKWSINIQLNVSPSTQDGSSPVTAHLPANLTGPQQTEEHIQVYPVCAWVCCKHVPNRPRLIFSSALTRVYKQGFINSEGKKLTSVS